MNNFLEKYKGFIFDLDGTLYIDDKMIDGAVETVNKLIENDKTILFVTNKTTNNREDYFNFLTTSGIKNISNDQILTAGENSISFFQKEKKGNIFYAIAEQKYISELENSGLIYSDKVDEIDFVVVTLDRNYSEEKFRIAKNALQNRAEFYAVNIDATCPVHNGEIVDAGKIINRLTEETGCIIKQHFGKPSQFMVNKIKERMEFRNEEYLLIGDRLETDIKMGSILGMDTALMQSGIDNDFESLNARPTYIFQSVKNILNGK